MQVTYVTKNGDKTVEVTDFYKDIAAMLGKESPDTGHVTVACEKGTVQYMLRRRSGTMFIVEESNTLPPAMAGASCPKRYLTCVNADKNAYKFYKMEPSGNELKVSYGRMGVEKGQLFGERTFHYPLSMFWVKYYEKLSKGYVDNTDVYLSADGDVPKNRNTEKETPRKPAKKQRIRKTFRFPAGIRETGSQGGKGKRPCYKGNHPKIGAAP